MDTQPHTQTTEYEAPAFPYEFVSIITDEAVNTLIQWLKANGVPAVVVDAINEADFLRHYETLACAGEVKGYQNAEAKEAVAKLTTAIALLGGSFHNGNSATTEREPLKWAPPATLGEWLAMYDRLSDEDRQEARAWMRELMAAEQARTVDRSGR